MAEEFQPILERIRAMFAKYEKSAVKNADEPARYYLDTHTVRPKDGYRFVFGGVEIKKNYVSAHVLPVYEHPEMLEAISPELRKRMQGKSCFNFKKLDEPLLSELEQLIDAGAERFKADGRLS